MRIMAAAALLLLLVSLAAAAVATPTSNTSDTRSEEKLRMFMEWKARHGHGTTNSSLTEEEEEHVYAFFMMDFCDIDQLRHDDGYSVFSGERGRSEEDTRKIFTEWKAMHGTTNSSLAEEKQFTYNMFKHRLGLIDRRWHDEGYSVFSWERGRSEEDTRKIFAEWKVREGVTYSSIAHEEHRYTIFKEALRDIDEHNAGYAIGVYNNNRCLDQFSHLIQEEFEAVCCGFWPEEPSKAKLQRIGEIQERLRQAFTRPLI